MEPLTIDVKITRWMIAKIMMAYVAAFILRGVKSFLFKNECVLCVWARYCVFLAVGTYAGVHLQNGFAWALIKAMGLLCAFFVVLALLPAEGKLDPLKNIDNEQVNRENS